MIVFASFLFLIANGALEWGPLKRQLPVTDGMVSTTRTTTSTIRRVGLEGRPEAEEAA